MPQPPKEASASLAREIGNLPDLSRPDDAYEAAAARALGLLVACIGAMLLAVALVQRSFGLLDTVATSRVMMASLMLAGGALALWLVRHGRQRGGAVTALVVTQAATGLHAFASGLGNHSLVLGGTVLLVTFARVLVGPLAGALLAVVNVLMVLALEAAQAQGLIEGYRALAHVGAETRATAHILLTTAGLLAAVVVRHRQLRASLHRAQQQERRMAHLLQIGSDWTWEADRRGRITYLSPSFETHTGLRCDEFMRIGEPGGPQPVRDTEWEQLIADLRARRPYRGRVLHFQLADGSALFVSGSGEPMSDAGGRFTGWWGASRNATAEVLAQRALQRSQAMLDRLVRLSPDAIAVASLNDGRILLANPSFVALAGRPESEVIGRNGLELGLFRDEAAMVEFGHAIRDTGWVRDFRTVGWTRDGQQHKILITAAQFDWDGEPVAVLTTRDITATERARQEADAILDNAVVGMALVRGQRFERVNPQLERMLGMAVGTLTGQPGHVVFPDRGRFDEFDAMFEEAQRRGETVDIERRVLRADGHKIVVRLRARAVDPNQPGETGTIWVVEDITERRRAETELAEAKRQAETASDAKSRFLATMSHEIRTPLSGVLGLARLLQDPATSPHQQREYLTHLVDAAEQLTGIVSDVLDLSKIEAGRLEVEHIPFDLHTVVRSTFRTFAPLGEERGLQMTWCITPDAPGRVLGDPVRVRQVLSNLLSNALKFTQRGGVDLRLLRGAGDAARVEVRDTGIGVSMAQAEQLFQPFTQGDSSTTRRFGGSGLGLSICRELALLMGGDVGVDSDGRHGSCFWVELPLTRIEMPAPGAAGAPEEPAQPLLGLRVLLAEDNPVNRLIAGTMLRRLGAEVIEAEDGLQAVELAKAATPTLHAVLMDLHMPELDGLEATRQLRARPATAHLPVIALSAAVLDAERAQAREAGMNGFVTKPASEAELLRALLALVPAAPGWPTS